MPNNAITHDLFISTFLPRLLPLPLSLPFSTATGNAAAYRHMTQQLPILPCAENSLDMPVALFCLCGPIIQCRRFTRVRSIAHSVLCRSVEFLTAGDFFGWQNAPFVILFQSLKAASNYSPGSPFFVPHRSHFSSSQDPTFMFRCCISTAALLLQLFNSSTILPHF